jgi:polyhydroxybutyrate depolymerase
MLTMVAVAAAEPRQLTVDGQARTFFLAQPDQQGPHPTIIMLHSGNGHADQEMQVSGLAEYGPQKGFVAVFPQAIGGYWNFYSKGKENAQYRAFFQRHGGVPDDIAFLKSIVAGLARDGTSDPRRIYLAGRSLGGVMVLRLACAEADRFAAIALFVSAMPDVTGSECQPAKPLPVLIINGTEDRVLPYRGERSLRGYVLWPTQRLITFFRQLNGCAQPAEQSLLPGYQERDVLIERSIGCAGAPVVLYSIVGGGHELPAGLNAGRILLDFLHDKKR